MEHSDNICKKEAARLLKISPSSFYRLIQKGELKPPFQIGGRSFYSLKEITAYNITRQQTRGFQKQRIGIKNVNKTQ